MECHRLQQLSSFRISSSIRLQLQALLLVYLQILQYLQFCKYCGVLPLTGLYCTVLYYLLIKVPLFVIIFFFVVVVSWGRIKSYHILTIFLNLEFSDSPLKEKGSGCFRRGKLHLQIGLPRLQQNLIFSCRSCSSAWVGRRCKGVRQADGALLVWGSSDTKSWKVKCLFLSSGSLGSVCLKACICQLYSPSKRFFSCAHVCGQCQGMAALSVVGALQPLSKLSCVEMCSSGLSSEAGPV